MSFRDVPGWWGDDCHRYFGELVDAASDGHHFLEVGAWQGRSAVSMAEHIRNSGKLIRWDSVDTWQGSPYGLHVEILADKPKGWLRERYEQHVRDAGLWRFVNPVSGTSAEAAKRYADGSLDLVFIDGDHRTEMVLADLRAWWPKLAPGGLMAGHDANSESVLAAVQAFEVEFTKPTPVIWEIRKPVVDLSVAEFSLPLWTPKTNYWESWIGTGFYEAFPGCASRGCTDGNWPLVRTPQAGKPFHVARVLIDGRTVWFDYSDYIQHFSEFFQEPYFKVQAVSGTLPAGQFVTDLGLLSALPALRSDRQAGRIRVAAMFSNIDELPERLRSLHLGFHQDKVPRRRRVLGTLKSNSCERDLLGMWEFGKHRPEIPESMRSRPLPIGEWWRAIADCEAVFALPGVGGDFTRLHTEALAIGAPLITIKTDQLWPGNFAGCWVEVERDLSDVPEVLDRHLADAFERERAARLGMWYYERELKPAAFARRLAATAKE